ncbi:vacuolar protein sorting-associated protein 37C isoform X1 [Scleropages formosus]|uniref:vacuolar protein sorting-associated protein 37C isoform X1 n=1 Tax=Scleropages formosus TaxID=113540 RepID=UPI0008781BE6|nr:vacuolar protein sorting-associated protein 37C-like isoform X1 [Scleropages formosus]
MEKLGELSQAELEELLDNVERVHTLALESDEVQNLQLEREMALASNRSLAEQNLDLKPRLEQGRERLVERYCELQEVRSRYEQRCGQRADSVAGQVSPEGLFSQLQTEGAATEAQSEELADHFLDGSLPLDAFLERFLSLRSLAHKRRVRIDKLQEILRQKTRGTADAEGPTQGPMASQTCASQQADAGVPLPWQPQQQQHSNGQGGNGSSVSFANASQPQPSPALPYSPYPISPAGPPNPPAPFPVYPNPGQRFPPGSGFSERAACPYPAQPPFPIGQFGAPPPAYSSPYPYTNFGYPTAAGFPPSQAPTGPPAFGPGFGVPFS